MSGDTPKVRDYSSQERMIPVLVEASPVYELLLSLFAYGSKNDWTEYECGSTFFEQFQDAVPEPLADRVTQLAECGEAWLPLVSVAHDASATASVEESVKYLSEMDPIALRWAIVSDHHAKDDLADADRDAAIAGDPETIARLVDDDTFCPGVGNLLLADPQESHRFIVDTLTTANQVLTTSIADVLPALRRDADEKQTLSRTMEPPALVEAATNGVTFKVQPQITGVLLIPSKIIRPWTVIMEHEGLSIFAYSVSDEHLMADADAPPSYLVDLFKALGDERRLRILGMLSEGEAGLMDIAERLDLAKSTAHHHLRILRTAGLVRVTVGDSKGYSLRRDQIPETARLLDAYLTTPAQAAENAATQQQRS
jgi:DNA-binding transcriptional ArsR family regulator